MNGFKKHGCISTYVCMLTKGKMYYFIMGYGEKSVKTIQGFP